MEEVVHFQFRKGTSRRRSGANKVNFTSTVVVDIPFFALLSVVDLQAHSVRSQNWQINH